MSTPKKPDPLAPSPVDPEERIYHKLVYTAGGVGSDIPAITTTVEYPSVSLRRTFAIQEGLLGILAGMNADTKAQMA